MEDIFSRNGLLQSMQTVAGLNSRSRGSFSKFGAIGGLIKTLFSLL